MSYLPSENSLGKYILTLVNKRNKMYNRNIIALALEGIEIEKQKVILLNEDSGLPDEHSEIEEAAMKLEFAHNDLTSHLDMVEKLNADTGSLSSIADIMETANDDNGLDSTSAQILDVGTENIYTRLGVTKVNTALESVNFGSTQTRKQSTQVALESISNVLKNIWAAIVYALKRTANFIREFFNHMFDLNSRLLKKALLLKTKVKNCIEPKKNNTIKVKSSFKYLIDNDDKYDRNTLNTFKATLTVSQENNFLDDALIDTIKNIDLLHLQNNAETIKFNLPFVDELEKRLMYGSFEEKFINGDVISYDIDILKYKNYKNYNSFYTAVDVLASINIDLNQLSITKKGIITAQPIELVLIEPTLDILINICHQLEKNRVNYNKLLNEHIVLTHKVQVMQNNLKDNSKHENLNQIHKFLSNINSLISKSITIKNKTILKVTHGVLDYVEVSMKEYKH